MSTARMTDRDARRFRARSATSSDEYKRLRDSLSASEFPRRPASGPRRFAPSPTGYLHMVPDVNASVMVPSRSSTQDGPPLLGRVRAPPRSPTSSLVRSPPTPPLPSTAAPVSPCRGLPRRGCFFLCGATCMASAGRARIHGRAARRRVITGSPSLRMSAEEKRGPPRCLDRPLATCRGRTPRRVRSPLALPRRTAVAFEENDPLGTRND